MKVSYNPNINYMVSPHIVNLDSDMTVWIEWPDLGDYKHPSRLTGSEYLANPRIVLLVKSSNGARLTLRSSRYGDLMPGLDSVLYDEKIPPVLPHEGLSVMTLVGLGGGVMMVCDVVLDLK